MTCADTLEIYDKILFCEPKTQEISLSANITI